MTTLLDNDIILSCVCNERDGKITRNVRLLTFDLENLRVFWEKARQFKTIFSKEFNDDFEKFCTLLMHSEGDELVANGVFYVVDDFVGVYYMTNIAPKVDAEVHFTFFDRRYNGRLEMTKQMLQYVFDTFQFRRLTAEIPYYATEAPHTFAKLLGFKFEGRKHKAIRFNADDFDVAIYGLLPEWLSEVK